MNWMIEFVNQRGNVTRVDIVQHPSDHPLDVMDNSFDPISEFIGKGYVEHVRTGKYTAAFVHEEGAIRGFTPNERADLHHFVGPVVLIKPMADEIEVEMIKLKDETRGSC